ncbi:MAG: hypothetical protein R6W71_09980 [Bacteroidales bacterium]
MKNTTVIIKLHEGRIWFNDRLSIDAGDSNLPVEEIRFGRVKEIYWLVEQMVFDKESLALEVKVVDYFLRDREKFAAQNPKTDIKKLTFINLSDTASLKMALKYYATQMNQLDEALEAGYYDRNGTPSLSDEITRPKNPLFRSAPEKDKIETTFEVWFKDAEFKLGYVVFDKNIPELKQMLRFKVTNDFLLPEFEFIKGYFVKALRTRKFDVDATIFLEHGKATETKASSSIIGKINERLIDSIKNIRTDRLFKAPFKPDIDKSLFTADEIFDGFGDDEAGNVFNQTEEEMLRHILEKAKVRNRKQLEFLAGVKQAAGARLKFTLHPYFGFLFTVEGEKMMHFIWELLNTHATYVWSLDKNARELRAQYRRVEDAINQVRNSGRNLYKQAYHSSHIDQDLVFHVIHHQDANSPLIDGFVKWRHRVGELMI